MKADKMLHIALKQAQDIGHEGAVTHIFILMANLAKEREYWLNIVCWGTVLGFKKILILESMYSLFCSL